MQCRDVAAIIEHDGLPLLSEGARGHLANCAACSSLVADLKFISTTARQLPSGRWTSKMGKNIDIEHNLEDIDGAVLIGRKRLFMRRSL